MAGAAKTAYGTDGRAPNTVPSRPRRARPRHPLAGAAWLAVVLAGAIAVTAAMFSLRGGPARHTTVVASMPYWNFQHGTAAVLAHRDAVTEVSPWMYGLAADGQIDTQYPAGQAAAVARDIARLRAAGLRVVPTIANITGGKWAYQPVGRMLHSTTLMARQVAAIAGLVQRHDYAGVDIDYENLHAGDRQAFSTFVRDLAAALHARGKLLSVAVFAKTSNAGTDPRNVAQDYAAIGRAADQVRLMGYDYHWATSPPGPIAPVDWIRAVLRYAKTQIPAGKIILGIPLYGYDWSGGPRHRDQLAAGAPAVPGVPRAAAVRRDQPGAVAALHRPGRAPAHRVVRERGQLAGQVRRWPRAPASPASTCGCTATRTPAPGRRCSQVLPTSGAHALSTAKAVP